MRDKKLIIFVILLMSIGFAVVSVNLIVNGGIKIGTNVDGFDVYFSEALLDGRESNKITLSGNRKTITYETNDLTSEGDTSELTYKVKNNSNIYNAKVRINCHTEENEYVTVTANFNGHETPAEDEIRAGEELPGKINARLKKGYAGDNTLEVEIKCEIEARAEERAQEDIDTDRLIYDLNNNETTYGSEVIIAHDIYYHDINKYSVGLNERYKLYCTEYQNDAEEGILLCNKKNKKGTCKKIENKTCNYEEVAGIFDKVKFTNQTKRYNFADAGNGNWHIQTYCNTVGEETDYSGGLYYCDSKKDLHDWYIIESDDGSCNYEVNHVWNYTYEDDTEQLFRVPCQGNYKIEAWGASGTDEFGGKLGGLGSYTSGIINLNDSNLLYMYIGESRLYDRKYNVYGEYAFNGGGGGNLACYYFHSNNYGYNYFGGGATDIRLIGGYWKNFESLKSRIMVAAGGGAGNEYQDGVPGGGINGYSGTNGERGTQTSSGGPVKGGFGYGGIPTFDGSICGNNIQSGAGSGWYGGGASNKKGENSGMYAAGSGSSYISGHNGCKAIKKDAIESNPTHEDTSESYLGYVFTNTEMIDGAGYKWTTDRIEPSQGMPGYEDDNIMTGNKGDGHVRITYLG